MFCIFFCAIGFFDEADSSILIYSELRVGLYTKWIALDTALIKHTRVCSSLTWMQQTMLEIFARNKTL